MKTILGAFDNPSIHYKRATYKIKQALEHVSDGDYVLWAGGDPMSAFLFGSLLDPEIKVKWLRWDKRTDANGNRTRFGYYTPVEC